MSDTLDFRVFDGTVVDTDRLRELINLLEGALAAVGEAQHHLTYIRTLVWANSYRAPVLGPHMQASIENVLGQGDSLAGLRREAEELQAGLVGAISAYEEAEHTAAAALRSRHPAFIRFLLAAAAGLVSPVGVALRLVPAVGVGTYVSMSGKAGRGVPILINAQGHLRNAALWFVPMINPTGVLYTREGYVMASELTPVEALASSLLDVTGFDHFGGNLRVWLDQEDLAAEEVPTTEVRDWLVERRELVPLGVGLAIRPLRSTADVSARMKQLARRGDASGLGEIELIAQRGADGGRSWTVVVNSTREKWAAGNPQDHLSNVQLVGEERADAMLAVLQAIEMAPIREGEPIIFVGHSQGGIVAAELAADPGINARYEVAGVITYGSPVGQVDGLTERAPALHLENVDDPIPGLDGLANEAGPRNLTVQFDLGEDATGSPHSIENHQEALARIGREGEAPEVVELLGDIEHAARWDEPAATAELYRFQFERTDQAENWADTVVHRGYRRR